MSEDAQHPAPRPRVLIVDDEPDDIAIARRELAKDFSVESTSSANGARELLRGPVRFDLVVIDYRLGDMNALRFLQETKDAAGACAAVVVVSGRDDPRVAAAARDLGAFAFLAKGAFGGGRLAAVARAAIDAARVPDRDLAEGPRDRATHRDVLARMSEGLYAVDEDGVIVLANPSFERLLGYERRALLGLGIESVMGPDALGATASCLARGDAFVETELVSRSGAAVPALVSPSPLVDPGGHVGVVRDFRDFRHRIGKLEEANRMLRDGLVEVAVQVLHNVGNAVASLDVRLEDLTRELASEEDALRILRMAARDLTVGKPGPERRAEIEDLVRDAAASLDDSSRNSRGAVAALRRGVEHIGRAVDYARTFAGRTRPVESKLDLRHALSTACSLVKDIARGRGLDLEVSCSIPPGVPLLDLPEIGFEQLLVNLLKNAADSIANRVARDPDAPRRVTIVARIEPDPRRRLELEVEDTGAGATSEVQSRAFELGFTTRKDGSGFGLHASAEFVERLGGRISLVSAGPDRGATVRVVVPLLATEQRERGEAA